MPIETRSLTARRFFGRGGTLSEWHPSYEFRAGQLEMAEAVESALADKRHLIVEAGTGTGKTLAYLVPALLSGRRVIVSTGTKNLQEQLFFKDIPFLQQHFSEPIAACYMKGRANYACRQKIQDAENDPILSGLEEVADYQIIRAWEKETVFGDRAEIRKLPESSSAWAKIDARGELCSGQKCSRFQDCFITAMHQRAAASDLIVVNHHLFFADLALRDDEYGRILPDYDAVIFDEAHEIEDVASQYFGVSVSSFRFEDLSRDASRVSRAKRFGSEEFDRVLTAFEAAARRFFACFGQQEGRRAFTEREAFLMQHDEEYHSVLIAVELVTSHLKLIQNPPDEVQPLLRRLDALYRDLRFLAENEDKSFVFWVERRSRGVFLQATPIDVAKLLEERLFHQIDSVILTSATLAVGGQFEFTQKRLGLEQARTVEVGSPFDYPKQAIFYVPQHMPDPRDQAFPRMAADEITLLLQASRGRAFVLFTSYQQMRLVYDMVSFDIPYPTLLQGTGPRSALLDEFRGRSNSVLFATSSFWQGVDVAGEQLSCVIIDKLPFAVPSDPIVDARIRAIRERGGNPFADYQIPQAAISLKQGFGRLIRTKTDRGALVLLDNRITKQRYGRTFLESLPPYRLTTNRDDVENFFNV